MKDITGLEDIHIQLINLCLLQHLAENMKLSRERGVFMRLEG